jgi:hypothetical protein
MGQAPALGDAVDRRAVRGAWLDVQERAGPDAAEVLPGQVDRVASEQADQVWVVVRLWRRRQRAVLELAGVVRRLRVHLAGEASVHHWVHRDEAADRVHQDREQALRPEAVARYGREKVGREVHRVAWGHHDHDWGQVGWVAVAQACQHQERFGREDGHREAD